MTATEIGEEISRLRQLGRLGKITLTEANRLDELEVAARVIRRSQRWWP